MPHCAGDVARRKKDQTARWPCLPVLQPSWRDWQVRARTAAVILDTERLQLELDRRGLTKDAFARAAGVSKNTITAAANGRRVSPRTVRQLVRTLVSIPPLRMVDELIANANASSSQGNGLNALIE